MWDSEFWTYVTKTETCWLWTRSCTTAGYGNFWSHDRCLYEYAHRHAYEELVGAIPRGMKLDHSCFVENCVNPAHLTPRTQKGNGENRRGAPSNSTSGIRGVSKLKKNGRWNGRWRAYAVHNNKQHHLGCFATKEEAEEAARAGRIQLYGCAG